MTTPRSTTPQFFQKKPVQVQAIQWPLAADPSDEAASKVYNQTVMAIFTWIAEGGGYIEFKEDGEDFYPVIRTLEGDMRIKPDAWIIRGIKGEFYPCESEIFDESYTGQARELRGQQKDFLAQIDAIEKDAEWEAKNLPPSERNVTVEKLGNVAGKGKQTLSSG